MCLYFLKFDIQEFAAWVSILIPIILFSWSYFSQKLSLSNDYYLSLSGIYAGFTEPLVESKNGVNSGIVMNLKSVDNSGYFKGEFDFAETTIDVVNNRLEFKKLRDGVHSFLY